MLNKFILIVVLMTPLFFSQTIEEMKLIYPVNYHKIITADSAVYIFHDEGILILKYFSPQNHELRNKINIKIFPNVEAVINKNFLTFLNSGSIYHYDINDLYNPKILHVWQAPSQLKRIVKFGAFYLFDFENDRVLKLMNMDANGFTYIVPAGIPYSKIINYPYVIVKKHKTIEFYKYTESDPFYFERIITEPHYINSLSAGDNLLISDLRKSVIDPPETINIRDLSQTGFPIIYSFYHTYTNLLPNISRTFYATAGGENKYINRLYSHFPINSFPKEYDFSIDSLRYYAYSSNVYCMNFKLNTLDYFYDYFSLPETGQLFQYNSEIVNLVEEDKFNFSIIDSINIEGKIHPGPNYFFEEHQSNFTLFEVIQNKIISTGSFHLESSPRKILNLNKYLFLSFDNGFKVLKKDSDTAAAEIYNSSEFEKINNADIYDSTLFVSDKEKGIIKFDIVNGETLIKRWNFNKVDRDFYFAKQNNYLIIRENNYLYLVDILTSQHSPSILDTFVLPLEFTYSDIIPIKNHFYLKANSSAFSSIMKFSSVNNKINYLYNVQLDQGNYNLVESQNYLIVFSEKKMYWIQDSTLTSIEEDKVTLIPENFSLSQNYPNPFNPTTKIKYSIPSNQNPLPGGAKGGLVTLIVYDVLGNEVSTLVNEVKSPGEYEVEFDGSNLSSGVYFYQIKSGNIIQTNKMILQK
jgi:hypothetical protein